MEKVVYRTRTVHTQTQVRFCHFFLFTYIHTYTIEKKTTLFHANYFHETNHFRAIKTFLGYYVVQSRHIYERTWTLLGGIRSK